MSKFVKNWPSNFGIYGYDNDDDDRVDHNGSGYDDYYSPINAIVVL